MRPRLDDPAWLDAQYDNRARVAGWAGHLERWAQASQAARDGSPAAHFGVAYGSDATETLDVFPAAAAGAPVLVYIHGGYWRALDKSSFSFIAPSFVADGVAVVVPDYALCPTVTVEHIALQTAAAVAWTLRHAASFGGDPRRVALAGHSAGGHLVAMLLCCAWQRLGDDLPRQPLGGALAISGLYDLEPIRNTPFLQRDLRLTPAAVKRLSPAFFPRPKSRLYAVCGGDESEEFIRQNRLIRDVWGPTAVPVCESASGADHFSVLESLVRPDGRLHELALRLLGLR